MAGTGTGEEAGEGEGEGCRAGELWRFLSPATEGRRVNCITFCRNSQVSLLLCVCQPSWCRLVDISELIESVFFSFLSIFCHICITDSDFLMNMIVFLVSLEP